MTSKQLTKRCAKCGHELTFFTDTWDKLEWANGKRFPARHRGCGGEFLVPVARLAKAELKRGA